MAASGFGNSAPSGSGFSDERFGDDKGFEVEIKFKWDSFRLNVTSSETAASLKDKVQNRTGFAPHKQHVRFCLQTVEGERALATFGIEAASVVFVTEVFLTVRVTAKLFADVTQPPFRNLPLEVLPEASAEEVRAMVAERTGLPERDLIVVHFPPWVGGSVFPVAVNRKVTEASIELSDG